MNYYETGLLEKGKRGYEICWQQWLAEAKMNRK
jgi:hypothetical protein